MSLPPKTRHSQGPVDRVAREAWSRVAGRYLEHCRQHVNWNTMVETAAMQQLLGIVGAYVYLEKGKGRWQPPCHTGSCKGGRRLGEEGDYEAVHRCQCGRDYVMRDGGKRFLERLPDGTFRPYMVHRSLRGWFPDSEEQA